MFGRSTYRTQWRVRVEGRGGGSRTTSRLSRPLPEGRNTAISISISISTTDSADGRQQSKEQNDQSMLLLPSLLAHTALTKKKRHLLTTREWGKEGRNTCAVNSTGCYTIGNYQPNPIQPNPTPAPFPLRPVEQPAETNVTRKPSFIPHPFQ